MRTESLKHVCSLARNVLIAHVSGRPRGLFLPKNKTCGLAKGPGMRTDRLFRWLVRRVFLS